MCIRDRAHCVDYPLTCILQVVHQRTNVNHAVYKQDTRLSMVTHIWYLTVRNRVGRIFFWAHFRLRLFSNPRVKGQKWATLRCVLWTQFKILCFDDSVTDASHEAEAVLTFSRVVSGALRDIDIEAADSPKQVSGWNN